MRFVKVDCPDCKGSGLYASGSTCPNCSDTGIKITESNSKSVEHVEMLVRLLFDVLYEIENNDSVYDTIWCSDDENISLYEKIDHAIEEVTGNTVEELKITKQIIVKESTDG